MHRIRRGWIDTQRNAQRRMVAGSGDCTGLGRAQWRRHGASGRRTFRQRRGGSVRHPEATEILRVTTAVYLLCSRLIRLEVSQRLRSEEHTSELQSLMRHLVCRLLLEKKKSKKNIQPVLNITSQTQILSSH